MGSQPSTQLTTVLVIDDEPSMLENACSILEQAGYQVVGAVHGKEGLQKALEVFPGLILIDHWMPDLNGIETFRLMVHEPQYYSIRETPVILLTSKILNGHEKKELMALGLAAYLLKPFGHRELINVIDNVLITHELKSENRRLQQELHDSFLETVKLLVNLLAIRDPATQSHSLTVLSLAEEVCHKLGLGGEDLYHIKLAALLHDIGKIIIPEDLLQKPEGLSPDEYVRMHQHVHYGYHALNGISSLATARELMFYHHENFDGSGYPRGLKGEEIPIGARIVAVVDAYDAMTSDRPYRKGLAALEARQRLLEAKSRQFDPQVVDALMTCLEDHAAALSLKTSQS
ncbi:MAG: HD domain-containing protein [Terriglobia bacterium]